MTKNQTKSIAYQITPRSRPWTPRGHTNARVGAFPILPFRAAANTTFVADLQLCPGKCGSPRVRKSINGDYCNPACKTRLKVQTEGNGENRIIANRPLVIGGGQR